MSKTYIVSRNGGTVTKAPINDNKIPIYANETALDADLANIPDNTLVATRGGHDDVIDQMKDYIRKQNELSGFEDITISTDSNNPTVMPYDGFFTISSANNGAGFVCLEITRDGIDIKQIYFAGENTTNQDRGALTIPIIKGDKLSVSYTSSTLQLMSCFANYYKNRDYTGR